jgi:ABC-type uncharacterized transport system substrate-binding protein
VRRSIYLLAVFSFLASSGGQAEERMPRIGLLSIVPATKLPLAAWFNATRETLAQQGFRDGKAVTYVYRDAQGDPERFRKAAADLVRQKVDVIYAMSARGCAPRMPRRNPFLSSAPTTPTTRSPPATPRA